MGKAARPLDAALTRGEPRLSQECRRVPILRGTTRVKGLAHRAEHLAQIGRLRRRQAKGR